MDRGRYKRNTEVEKTSGKHCKEAEEQTSVVQQKTERVSTSQTTSKSLPKESVENRTEVKNGDVLIDAETAGRLHLAMLQQAELMRQVADVFVTNGHSVSEDKLEADSKGKMETTPKVAPKSVPNEESKDESEDKTGYEPKHDLRPATQPVAKDEKTVENEARLEPGLVMAAVYEFNDPETGEKLRALESEYWFVYQLVGRNYVKRYVLLKNGEFVGYAKPADLRAQFSNFLLK